MSEQRIKLEELLRLKRVERPSKDEWRNFDAELKRRLVYRIVNRPSLAERLFAKVQPRSAAAFAFAASALAAAVLGPMYLATLSSSAPSASVQIPLSSTPLPSVSASYAVNEIPSDSLKDESPVFAQINSVENKSVRYVSNGIAGVGSEVAF